MPIIDFLAPLPARSAVIEPLPYWWRTASSTGLPYSGQVMVEQRYRTSSGSPWQITIIVGSVGRRVMSSDDYRNVGGSGRHYEFVRDIGGKRCASTGDALLMRWFCGKNVSRIFCLPNCSLPNHCRQ